ncbi:hypothetical protein [Metabacillus litoralis]|uniref:hypothetical protein n=1 Tax=Metabacillus litoralis TaxID=152268 RepID=UPI00204081D6|nr:hypothetical protein [Metabacillus litoralis]MCM3413524.1 hypothetical protein [Metabacillus litoralis]
MGKQFEFADFVDEFKVNFVAYEQSKGHWLDSGKWVEGEETPVEMVGIMLPLSQNDLRQAENGEFSVKDKKIYTTGQLSLGQKVEYKGDKYTIQSFKDYSDYADVYIYYARWREK